MNDKRGKLSDAELSTRMRDLTGWTVAGGKLHREYDFKDFVKAWGFMSSAALIIQTMDHHPEWFNVYGKVRIDLVTHSAGGITSMDADLAQKLENLAGRWLEE